MLRRALGSVLGLFVLAAGCSLANAPDDVKAGGEGGSSTTSTSTTSTSDTTGSGAGTSTSSTGGGGASLCGNGTLDPGETCDGDCPASCDDADACTADALSGSAANCTATCAHDPVTTCSDAADGCCPGSCDGTTDRDCAMCGNGVVEIGEACDGDCPASCDDGDACTTDGLTGSVATCDAACTHDAVVACVGGDGCCPAGCSAQVDADCCGNPGGGSTVAENGTSQNEWYCFNPGDSAEIRAQKACESHFGVGQCCVIPGGYNGQQYGQCNQGGDGTTIHWHWDNHPDSHCDPIYKIGDVVSPGWCGAIIGNFLD